MKKKNNTFKFIGFNERISAIHVDSVLRYKTALVSQQPSTAETFFFETLEKWSDLDGTLHFDNFKRSVPKHNLQTYAQVLHYQKEIVNSLKTHLAVEQSMCLPAIFDLTIAICRDLQSDFYPYFWDFFDVIKGILERSTLQDVDILENSFSCYAHLFKFCWRRLCNELDDVFRRFLPLISHKRAYIRRFASESVSFLIRKCKDFDSFLSVCIESIENQEATLESIGQLLYESMKGVKKSLQTVAPEIYSNILARCQRDKNSNALSIAEELTTKLLACQSSSGLICLLNILVEKTGQLIHENSGHRAQVQFVTKFLGLCTLWFEDRRIGKFFCQKFDQIFQLILRPLIQKRFFNDNPLIVSSLEFLQKLSNLEVKSVDFLTTLRDILALDSNGQYFELYAKFLRSLLEHSPIFDSMCSEITGYLHRLSGQRVSDQQITQMLDLYCEILDFKTSLWATFDEGGSLAASDFEPNHGELSKRVLSTFELEIDDGRPDRWDRFLHGLYLYPFFVVKNSTPTEIEFSRIFDKIQNAIDDADSKMKIPALILALRMRNFGKITAERPYKNHLQWFFEHLSSHSCDLLNLQALQCLLVTFPEICMEFLPGNQAVQLLQSNVLHHCSSIRVKTLEILSTYAWTGEKAQANRDLFHLMLTCEKIPLDLQSYREKLLIYKKLSASEFQRYLPENNADYRAVVLKFLIGQLNVNFTLLLPTLKESIESHARLQAQNEFWDVYVGSLSCVQQKMKIFNQSTNEGGLSLACECAAENELFIRSMFTRLSDDFSEIWANYANLRLRLWQTMENFADLAGSKSRYLSDLVLELAEFELKIGSDKVHTENFEKNSPTLHSNKEEERAVLNYRYKTLKSCLVVYSKFSDIKNVSKEKRMKDLYLQLLMNGRPDVQKASLDCILAYKSKSLAPYRDHLCGLLFDKQFKDELVLFNVDSEANLVQSEHRGEVMEILLKLLYGRLLGKGSDNQRKEQIYRFLSGCYEAELETFLNYLFDPLNGHLSMEETIDVVCQRIFTTYQFNASIPFRKLKGILAHLLTVTKRLSFALKTYNSKILRIICLLGAIFCKIRSEKDSLQVYYVKASKKLATDLVARLAQFFTHFENYSFNDMELKCIFDYCLRPMLERGDVLYVAPTEILNLCRIWSEVPRFHPLLAIYNVESTLNGEVGVTVLDLALRSLNAADGKTSGGSVNRYESIAQIVVNLIDAQSTANDAGVDEEGPSASPSLPLPSSFRLKIVDSRVAAIWRKFDQQKSDCSVAVDGVEKTSTICDVGASPLKKRKNVDGIFEPDVGVDWKRQRQIVDVDDVTALDGTGADDVTIHSSNDVTLGVEIVVSHSSILLDFIGRRSLPSNKQPLCRKDKWAKILALLTRRLDDKIDVVKLLSILLPIVKSKVVKNPLVEAELVTSIDSLLQKVEDKEMFLLPVAELFGTVSHRQSRDCLMLLLKSFASGATFLQPIPNLIIELNSWDKKRIEEPNFERRIAAFLAVQKLLKCENPNIQLSDVQCCFVVYTCLHFIAQVDDLALRDNAGYTLRVLVGYTSKCFEIHQAHAFLTSHILPAIKVNLKSREEPVRHEILNLLGACVKFFPNHPKLVNILPLTDIDDPDLNFFENITHIQLHRRCRAIRRLCEKLDEKGDQCLKIHSETLFTFFWPICYSFVFDPSYAKNSMLIEESVRFLAVYCKKASWKRYESMLKYYLQKLRKDVDKQKLLVKIIVAILDAFHFDVKNWKIDAIDPNQVILNNSKNDEIVDPNQEILENSKNDEIVDPNQEILEHSKNDEIVDPNQEILEHSKNDEIVDPNQGITKPLDQQEPLNQDENSNKAKIFDSITKNFVPELQNCLVKRTSTDVVHKSMKKAFYDEDEEILRVPLALALVKLLQKLGAEFLENSLPNVLTKICQMLKSRSWDIRETTRKVLCQIGQSLSSRYLPYIVKEMRGILKRGYQTHVLTYSVNVLLNAVCENLKPGDLDPCLDDILAISGEDLFGEVAEQKEVDEITKHLKEARANKTVNTYRILGRFIGSTKLHVVIAPLKEVLETKFVHKNVAKVNDVLRNFAQGLIHNECLDVKFLMIYVHNLLQNNLPLLSGVKKPDVNDESLDRKSGAKPVSCFIIEPAPHRTGALPKKFKSSSLHVLVVFAFDILDNLLKTGRLQESDGQHCAMLDPYLTLYIQCFEIKQTKVIALSMRCLLQSMKFALPSMQILCPKIVQQIFVLLSRFAGLGSASSTGENQELLSVLFKTITTIIKDSDYVTLNEKQLKILLNYVEEDLHDSQKQSTAFGLVKAILSRKLACPEIKSVVECVQKLSVESQSNSTRDNCRSVLQKFLSNYPSGRRSRRFVEFFCAQLQYEYESGRDSALDTLAVIIQAAKPGLLHECALLMFVHLAVPIVNDESSKIRRKACGVVKGLVEKVDSTIVTSMLQMVSDWLADKKLVHKKLAAQLLGLFVEKMDATHLERTMQQCLCVCESLAERENLADSEEISDSQLSAADHVIYLVLVFMEKTFTNPMHCQLIRNAKFSQSLMDRIWGFSIQCLDHAHAWVKYSACRLLGVFFTHFKPEEILANEKTSEEFFVKNCRRVIRSLCLSCIKLLRAQDCSQDLAEQIIKNLVYLTRCVKLLSLSESAKDNHKNDVTVHDEDQAVPSNVHAEDSRASLKWLVVQMTRICRFEVAQFPHQTVRRSNLFKWFASLVLEIEGATLTNILPIFLPSLYREITVIESADDAVKILSSEVVELIKGKIGMENFVKYWAEAHNKSAEKRVDRKTKIAQEAVTDPEKASKRKLRRNKTQKDSRKRKLLEKQGKSWKISKKRKTDLKF